MGAYGLKLRRSFKSPRDRGGRLREPDGLGGAALMLSGSDVVVKCMQVFLLRHKSDETSHYKTSVLVSVHSQAQPKRARRWLRSSSWVSGLEADPPPPDPADPPPPDPADLPPPVVLELLS